MKHIFILFLYLSTLLCYYSFAQQTNSNALQDSSLSDLTLQDTNLLIVDHYLEDTVINSIVYVFVDSLNNYSREQLATVDWERGTDTFSVSNYKHHLWIKFKVKNVGDRVLSLTLLEQSGANYVDVFISDADSGWIEKKMGTFIPKKERDIVKYQLSVVGFHLQSQEVKEVYLRIRQINHMAAELNLAVIEQRELDALSWETTNIWIHSFVAVLAIMFLYSLMVFISTSESMYLYYSLYILSIATFIMFAGGSQRILINPIINEYMIIASFGGMSIFYFQFGRKFLNLIELYPKWDKIVRIFIISRCIVLAAQLIYLAIDYHIQVSTIIELSLFFVDAILTVCLFFPLIRSKSKLAYFFIAGSSLVFVLALSYVAITVVILQDEPDFVWFFAAIIIEILIFSLGLGYRMKQMERDKLEAKEAELQAKEELLAEQSKINTAFGRFVPDRFLKALDYKGILDVELGHAKEKEVTVFFSDIRAYTSLSESMTPEENFRFLNAYLGRVGPLINHNHGFVNQYYGDGIMALFLENAADAVRASIKIHQTVREYNLTRKLKDRMPIRIGIGLHTGKLMMGIIGDTLRMEASVVSDTVNTASRMEGLTKYYGASILVSEFTLRKIENPNQFNYRYLGLVQVKGRKTPMRIYEFFDGETEDLIQLRLQSLAHFNEGIKCYYNQQFPQAANAFQEVIRVNPSDKTAQSYLHKSTKIVLEGAPDNWTGVETMLSK